MLAGSVSWHRTLQHWLCRILIVVFLAAPLGLAPAAVQASSCGGLTDVIINTGAPYHITVPTTWTPNHVYVLNNSVQGDTGVTLTIQAGTIFKVHLCKYFDKF